MREKHERICEYLLPRKIKSRGEFFRTSLCVHVIITFDGFWDLTRRRAMAAATVVFLALFAISCACSTPPSCLLRVLARVNVFIEFLTILLPLLICVANSLTRPVWAKGRMKDIYTGTPMPSPPMS